VGLWRLLASLAAAVYVKLRPAGQRPVAHSDRDRRRIHARPVTLVDVHHDLTGQCQNWCQGEHQQPVDCPSAGGGVARRCAQICVSPRGGRTAIDHPPQGGPKKGPVWVFTISRVSWISGHHIRAGHPRCAHLWSGLPAACDRSVPSPERGPGQRERGSVASVALRVPERLPDRFTKLSCHVSGLKNQPPPGWFGMVRLDPSCTRA